MGVDVRRHDTVPAPLVRRGDELCAEPIHAVTVEPYSAYNEWRFLAPEDAGGYEILRIRASDAGEYQDRFEESYTLVAESGGVNYYMSVTADSGAEYYLPLDACIRQFRLIDW